MRDDDHLEDLPEAVTLYRVAPFWRLLAIFAAMGVAGLLFVVLILGVTLVRMESSSATYVSTAARPAVKTMIVGGGATAVEADPENDAQNMPYPVKADLAERDALEPSRENQPPPGKARSSGRARFLDKGTDLWNLKGPLPDYMVISSDGERVAYVVGGDLMAGPIGDARQIVSTVVQTMPGPIMRGRGGKPLAYASPMGPMVAVAQADVKLLGLPSWSPDNISVYCADVSGHLRRYTLQGGGPDGQADSQLLPFNGDSPTSLPTEPEKLIFVRSQPRPKVDVPGTPVAPDLTEVVQGDLTTKEVRVLVPASASGWHHLAVSPDGKRLALVSDRGQEGKGPPRQRVFVLDLAGGEPKPLTPPASQVGPVRWAADGQTLVYARSQEPLPADYWEEEPPGATGALDLYQWDLAANRETRLSRGGGFFSPSLTGNDDLFYLTRQEAGSGLLLRRMRLADARSFASGEPQPVTRDAAAWTALVNRVLEDSKIAADVDGAALTSEVLAKLAENFNKLYREQFKAEPASTLKGFGRQRRELQRLKLPQPMYTPLTLLLGAVEGEHLVRHHGARWHLGKGPLVLSVRAAAESEVESPFGYLANPFESVSAWARLSLDIGHQDREEPAGDEGPVSIVRKAEGRTLVLTNDPAAGRTAVAELADPDLPRGAELLKQGKGEQAEQVFLNMLQQKRHEQNFHLALQAGKLLYEHKRLLALQRLMERQCELRPHDARKFNLLGLSLLEAEPRQAIDTFKNALRCNVYFGPAYLNLAQAYQVANDLDSARQCLRRYLALMPDDAYAADARRRLAAVDNNGSQ